LDVSNVNYMDQMFDGASSFNSNLSNWDVSNVAIMWRMFYGASSFNSDLGGWDISSVNTMTFMLNNSGLSVDNYDNTLIGWESQMVSGLSLGAVGLEYCTSVGERNSLINNYGWTITGDNFDCSALPVELLDFNARLIENREVKLTWRTASEQNNSGYEIQRSKDGTGWERIGFVAGKGTTDELTQYEYLDSKPFLGLNYYRLKQIDYDGAYEFSPIEVVNTTGTATRIEIYPNPATATINITGADTGELKITNSLGEVVSSAAFSNAEFDISTLPPGVYFITISTKDQLVTRRIVKQ
jgi:surface protein